MRFRDLHLEPHPYPGRLIIVEGLDGAGKTTLIAGLVDALTIRGRAPIVTKQPTPEARLNPLFESYIYEPKSRSSSRYVALTALMLSDRLAHIESTIRPALAAGATVISDRYVYTMLVSMLARGVSYDFVWAGAQFAIQPDVSFHVTADYPTMISRIQARDSAKESYVEDDIYPLMHQAYAEAAADQAMVTLDTSNSTAEATIQEAMKYIR